MICRMVTITRNSAIIRYSVTFFLSLKARTAFAAGLFCRKIVARVSLPISAHASSTHLSESAHYVSAVCLSQQSSVFSRPLPLPGFAMRCCYWSGCSSIITTRQSGQCSDKSFPWRRLLTPALGGLAAGLLLMGSQVPSNGLMRRPITWKR